ncbi:MAG: GerMN domain-containing protein [Bacilli bacterium]|nr:GerMN domain-containing protein [Bacilli bacterium]
MLKKIYLKKILVSLSALFAIFMIYLIPNAENNKLNNIKEELTYIDTTVQTNNIYLLDTYNMLGLTNVMVSGESIEEKAKELIETLINSGPNEDRIPSGFKGILPTDTKIIDLKIENKIIKINFSKELLDIPKDQEEKMIEAITYTLTSLDEIEGIIIYIEGNILNKLPQTNITLPSTLNRNYGINKEYDITTFNDITSVTTYYINKVGNEHYYVPVTKYLNDDREKIRIVVDELGSYQTYNTNLMSFLNSNTKLISVEQIEDSLNLNFNEYIYNDLDKKEILEEVLYTICLSVHDNYNVNQVVINVNNEEIYKSVLKTIE